MTIKKRNPNGTIAEKELSSEEAAEMGRISHGKKITESANVLLAEDGFDDDNPPPEHLRLLAEYSASGKAGSVAALRDYRRLTRKDTAAADVAKPEKPGPGSVCPLCDELVMTDFRPSKELLDEAAEFIERDNIRLRNWLPKTGKPLDITHDTGADPIEGKTNGE